MAIAWEVTRIAIHCDVKLDDIDFKPCDRWWTTQKELRNALRQYAAFKGKAFPEESDASAWAAAQTEFRTEQNRDHVVLLSALMEVNTANSGPFFTLHLQPLKLEQSCRLRRKYGPDRFLELLMPSLKDGEVKDKIIHWMTRVRHSLLGCSWAAFWVKDAGHKQQKDIRLGPDPKPVYRKRVYLFAESGVSVSTMINWLLQLKSNQGQPVLKLFSRISIGR